MKNGKNSLNISAERAREETFGLAGVKLTLPDGRVVFLTMAQVELLKEEVSEYNKTKREDA